MKNSKSTSYLDIKNLLISNNVNPVSILKDNEIFSSINSLANANENELTFFNDTSQINLLKNTKAKACLINEKHLKFLPNTTKSILVQNTYNAFAILSNLFAYQTKSNGIISEYSLINNTSQYFTKLPRFPISYRDIALVVDKQISASSLLKTIRDHKLVISVDLFDEFIGDSLPSGHRSLAFRIHFYDQDHTLTSEEINESVDKMLKKLRHTTGATIRETN